MVGDERFAELAVVEKDSLPPAIDRLELLSHLPRSCLTLVQLDCLICRLPLKCSRARNRLEVSKDLNPIRKKAA